MFPLLQTVLLHRACQSSVQEVGRLQAWDKRKSLAETWAALPSPLAHDVEARASANAVLVPWEKKRHRRRREKGGDAAKDSKNEIDAACFRRIHTLAGEIKIAASNRLKQSHR